MSSEMLHTTRDLELVAWLAEQYGASGDQITRALHCSSSASCAKLKRLRAQKLVESCRIFADEP